MGREAVIRTWLKSGCSVLRRKIRSSGIIVEGTDRTQVSCDNAHFVPISLVASNCSPFQSGGSEAE